MRPVTIPAMRSFVESTFTCQVKVQRQTGTAMDPVTLEEVPVYDVIFDGKALVYARDLDGRRVVVGESLFTISKYVVVLPAHTPVKLRDRVTVTASPDEPRLGNLTLVLVDVPLDAWGVAQQCIAETLGGP